MVPLTRLYKSFKDAWRGIAYVFNNEQNFRLQTWCAVLVLVALWYFPLVAWERVLLLLLTAAVLIMELLNTALENFTDLLKPRLHHYVGVIKDIMAGAVLLTALVALCIGTYILWPHFIALTK